MAEYPIHLYEMSTNSTAREPRPLIELRAADATVVVDPDHGGRLASLRIRGRDLLVGPPEPRDSSISWGSFLMAPWPGRLADGRLRWRGRTMQLPRTHGRHAIHGLVHGVPWAVGRQTASEAQLSVELAPLGWPFGGRVRQRLRLEPGLLTLEAAVEADRPMPAALGWHPWFRRGDADPRLRVDADAVLETDAMIPTGRIVPVHGRIDLRSGPALGRRRLDHAYVGARSPAVIAWPDLELTVEFPSVETVVVYTPRGSFCVEPQTAWPNALGLASPPERSLAGARHLAAGERLETTLRMRWT
jgi:aldose 1-epimerase